MNYANQTYEQAKADTVLAEQAKQAAIEQVAAEKANVDKAQELVDAAQKALDDAKLLESTAADKIKQGSFGFFEAMGATEALDVLNNARLHEYTIKGDPNDATSLENMKIALDTLKRYYEILDSEGIEHSMISDRGMAIAQSNANASADSHGHTGQFNWTENLAWGYKPSNPEGFKDPYVGWYDKEKENYENGVKDPMAIGHYQTIITGYSVTGIAFGRVTYSQVFGGGKSVESDPLFTYEEYYARFMNYYNSLMNAPTITEAAQKKLDEAKATLDSAKSVYDQAVADAQRASENYNAVKATEDSKKLIADNKTSAYNQAVITADEKSNAVKDKEAAVNSANAILTTAKSEADTAKGAVDKAQADVSKAEQEYEDAKATTSALKEDADSKEDAFKGLLPKSRVLGIYTSDSKVGTVDEAKAHLTLAEEELDKILLSKEVLSEELRFAENEAQEKSDLYDASVNTVAEKNSLLDKAIKNRNDIEAAIQSDIAIKRSDMETKLENLNQLKENLDQLNAVLEEKNTAYAEAKTNLEKADKDLQVSKTALGNTIVDQGIAEQAYNNAKKAYDAVIEQITPLWNAQNAVKDAEDALTQAGNDVTNAENAVAQADDTLTQAIADYESAKDLNERASKLSFDDALENPVTDADFAYLNDYIAKIREADQAVLDAKENKAAKEKALETAEADYESAKQAHLLALADLAVAQSDYDRMVKEQEAAENDKRIEQLSSNAIKESKSVKTGDTANAAGLAALVAASGAAVIVATAKKKKSDL